LEKENIKIQVENEINTSIRPNDTSDIKIQVENEINTIIRPNDTSDIKIQVTENDEIPLIFNGN